MAKKRLKGELPVLVDSLDTAAGLGVFNAASVELAKKFWPGPLTLVVPSRVEFPAEISGIGKVGLRVPRKRETLDLIRACGGTLVGTSANISGMPSGKTADSVLASLGPLVDLVLDGGPCQNGQESTVVEALETECRILREGAIDSEAVRILLRGIV